MICVVAINHHTQTVFVFVTKITLANPVCFIMEFLMKRNIPLVSHPHYMPDLAYNDLFLFNRLMSVQKLSKFE